MSDGSGHTPYHPRWLRPRMSTYWWLGRWSHVRFIARELSSVFVAWFVVYFLLLIRAVGEGPSDYLAFLEWARSPVVVAVNVVSLGFVVYHTLTWFNLAPRALVVRLRGRRLPAWVVAGSNYLAWAATSVAVAWLLLGG